MATAGVVELIRMTMVIDMVKNTRVLSLASAMLVRRKVLLVRLEELNVVDMLEGSVNQAVSGTAVVVSVTSMLELKSRYLIRSVVIIRSSGALGEVGPITCGGLRALCFL